MGTFLANVDMKQMSGLYSKPNLFCIKNAHDLTLPQASYYWYRKLDTNLYGDC